MARAAKKAKRYRFPPKNPDAPRLLRAASTVLGILTHVRKRTIADLDRALLAGSPDTAALAGEVVLTDDERALLSDPELVPVLFLLRAKLDRKDKRDIALTVAVCPECGEWVLASSSALGKCALTRGCSGKPEKASPAVKREIKDDDPLYTVVNGRHDAAASPQSDADPGLPFPVGPEEPEPELDVPEDGEDDDPFA